MALYSYLSAKTLSLGTMAAPRLRALAVYRLYGPVYLPCSEGPEPGHHGGPQGQEQAGGVLTPQHLGPHLDGW